MTLAPRSHGHTVLVRTPDGPGLPLAWRVTTVRGETFTSHHVVLGHVVRVECHACEHR